MKRTPTLATLALLLAAPAAAHADGLTCRAALAVVIDKSAAAGPNYVLSNAAVATHSAVDRLTGNDCFTVIAVDSRPTTVVPLRSPADSSGLGLAPLENLRAAGTLDVVAGLSAARTALAASGAQKRLVVLLTVGRTPSTPPLTQLLGSMKNDHITVSTFTVGTNPDEPTLKTIATTTGGHYRAVDPANRLPTAFFDEMGALLGP